MQGQWLEQTVGHEITLLASDRHRAAGSHKQVISQFPVVSGLVCCLSFAGKGVEKGNTYMLGSWISSL